MKIEEIREIVNIDCKEVVSSDINNTEDSVEVVGVGIISNYLDSHNTMFTRACLEDSLNNTILHNADHIRDFDHLISNEITTSVERMSLRSLNVDNDSDVDVFKFKSVFEKDDNPSMFRQYKKNRVRYHSIEFDWNSRIEYLCINPEYAGNERSYAENWEKYYPLLINKEVADKRGWFTTFEKAPILAVSAVVLGSNRITPTLSVRGYSEALIKLNIEKSKSSRSLIDVWATIINKNK